MKKTRSLKKKAGPFYRMVKRTVFCIIAFLRIFIPAKKNYWAFPVHFVKNSFCDNVQAVFESVKKDAGITKIIFTKGEKVKIDDAVNVLQVNMYSFKAIWLLAQCRVIFIQHSLALDFVLKFRLFRSFLFNRSIVVNLWHGIAIKYIRSMVSYVQHAEEHKHYSIIVASSKVDKLVMAASFYPALFKNILTTGLPRNDYLLVGRSGLPSILQKQLTDIENITRSKKLILYAPTYRQLGRGGKYYSFTEEELATLKKLLRDNNAILGLRPHHQKFSKMQFSELIDDELFFNMGTDRFADMSMLIRKADLIITDYSSLFVDALYLDKSQISFAYDLEHYETEQRGLFYDFKTVFPGPICEDFESLIHQMQNYFSNGSLSGQKNNNLRKMFFDDIDSRNSIRVVEAVKKLL